MGYAQSLLFVFLAGLTLCGLTGSFMQILTGAQLGFSPPYVRRDRLALSLAAAVLAGPFMLLNDAFKARNLGRFGNRELLAAGVVSFIWLMSLGVLIIEIVLLLAHM